MRRSSCPSVKRARLQLDKTPTANDAETKSETQNQPAIGQKVSTLDSDERDFKTTRNDEPTSPAIPIAERDASSSCVRQQHRKGRSSTENDPLQTVADLESRNADKLSELKLIFRTSEKTDHLALLRRGIDDDDDDPRRSSATVSRNSSVTNTDDGELCHVEGDDDDQRRERLLEELRCWEEAERELDEELLSRSKKTNDEIHIDKLHEYNDLKDACQAVFGRLAEMEEVTVSDIYKRYNLNIGD